MYFMYVDESGDAGMPWDNARSDPTPTRYFVLSGFVLHELSWTPVLTALIDFRRNLRKEYGVSMKEELHCASLLTKPGALSEIPKYKRLAILRHYADLLASFPDISFINVVVDKKGKPKDYDPFDKAWGALLQRYENTISGRNFPGPSNADERGLVVPDATDSKKLITLSRKLRKYNPVPSRATYGIGYRNLLMTKIIEDPVFRDSKDSLFIQSADLVAFLLYQHLNPSKYMANKQGQNYFDRLEPVLCKKASTSDPRGIVRL